MEEQRPSAPAQQLADQLGGLQLQVGTGLDQTAAAAAAAGDCTPAFARRSQPSLYTPLHTAAGTPGGDAFSTPLLMAAAPPLTSAPTSGRPTGRKPKTLGAKVVRNAAFRETVKKDVEEAAASGSKASAAKIAKASMDATTADTDLEFGPDTRRSILYEVQVALRDAKARHQGTQLAETGSLTTADVHSDRVGNPLPGSTDAMERLRDRRHQASRLTKYRPSRLGGN